MVIEESSDLTDLTREQLWTHSSRCSGFVHHSDGTTNSCVLCGELVNRIIQERKDNIDRCSYTNGQQLEHV